MTGCSRLRRDTKSVTRLRLVRGNGVRPGSSGTTDGFLVCDEVIFENILRAKCDRRKERLGRLPQGRCHVQIEKTHKMTREPLS